MLHCRAHILDGNIGDRSVDAIDDAEALADAGVDIKVIGLCIDQATQLNKRKCTSRDTRIADDFAVFDHQLTAYIFSGADIALVVFLIDQRAGQASPSCH